MFVTVFVVQFDRQVCIQQIKKSVPFCYPLGKVVTLARLVLVWYDMMLALHDPSCLCLCTTFYVERKSNDNILKG